MTISSLGLNHLQKTMLQITLQGAFYQHATDPGWPVLLSRGTVIPTFAAENGLEI